MKKRGATIKHKAASMPGALAMSICPEYETRLRLAVNALSDGWMEEGQFNYLADTIDMLQIGMASYSKQKPDPSTAVAVDVCREAMMSIRGRYIQTGKFGATGEELKAIHLLADVSLDFWRRRSGALFAFSVRQLKELRADQRDEAKQLKEETETMNARDNAPALPAIDGTINAAHGLLLKSGDALSADDVAKALAIKKTEASKQLRELHGLGLLESEPRKGGTMYFRLAVVAPAKVCDLVQIGGESQTESGTPIDWQAPEMQHLAPEDYELPPADPALLASANRMLSDRLERVAHVLRGCGLPALTEISDQEDLQMAAAALSGAYQMALADAAAVPDLRNTVTELDATVTLQRETLVVAASDVSRLSNELATERRASASAMSAVASICEHLGCDDHNGHVPVLRAIDDLRAQITSLTADVMRTRGSLNSAINEADRLRAELAVERQACKTLQERASTAPVRAATSFIVRAAKRKPRTFSSIEKAREAAMAAIRAGAQRAEVCPMLPPIGVARKGAEWRAA